MLGDGCTCFGTGVRFGDGCVCFGTGACVLGRVRVFWCGCACLETGQTARVSLVDKITGYGCRFLLLYLPG